MDLGIVADDRSTLTRRPADAAARADVGMTSGAVSVGTHDLVKAVLQDLGRIDFRQVAVQPARPIVFGALAGRHLFGLSGNPGPAC